MKNGENTLDGSDALQIARETGQTVCEVQEKHEIVNLPDEGKSKDLIKSESEIEKAQRKLAEAEARHQKHVEEMQQFRAKQLQSVKLRERIAILTRQIGELAHGADLLNEKIGEHAGTNQHVHELLRISDAIASNKHAREILPAALAELESALAQIDAEIAETKRRLGIKAD
jgi:hypothetical protein